MRNFLMKNGSTDYQKTGSVESVTFFVFHFSGDRGLNLS